MLLKQIILLIYLIPLKQIILLIYIIPLKQIILLIYIMLLKPLLAVILTNKNASNVKHPILMAVPRCWTANH